jgi:hypothetical protein
MRRAPILGITLAIFISLSSPLHALEGEASAGQRIAGQPLPAPSVGIHGPVVLAPVVPAKVKIDMRTLPVAPPSRANLQGPNGSLGSAGGSPGIGPASPAIQGRREHARPLAPAPVFATVPGRNFDGISINNVIPADTVIDVGPNHIVEAAGGLDPQFQIFSKTGTSLAGPSPINSLWTAAGLTNACATRNDDQGDPIVLYDHLADRWLVSQFAFPNNASTPPTFECVAVSQTPNPAAGTWNLYQFQFNNAFDYPKLGVWPDAYYMSSQRNNFPANATTPSLDAYALDRANMLAGNAVTPVQFTLNGPTLMLLPSDLDGPAPPAGTPAFFARAVDGDQWGGTDRIDLFQFSYNATVPLLSTFTALPSIATAPFSSNLCNTGSLNDPCVPQQGTTQRLATLPHYAMYSLQFRTLGGFERMVFNHTVDADGNGHAAPMWHELRRVPAGAWTLFQEGIYAPDNGNPGLGDDLHRWMGSIAMDVTGNIALGYSTSSSTTFPSVMATGRRSTDAAGQFPNGDVNIQPGGGSQTPIMCGTTACGFRWGDYSAMRVDPVDGCTFWYAQEYIPSTSAGNINWRTRIAALRFSTCTAAATLTLSPKTATNPVDSQHCVTATVKDAGGNLLSGVTVRFSVTGSVNTSGSGTTNASGQATFCYTGPALPGSDVISAYADNNTNNTQDPGEPSDTAAKIWTPPGGTPCTVKVTNGGWIVTGHGDRASFGGVAKETTAGLDSGNEKYQDHGPADPMNVKATSIVDVTCGSTTMASIFGTATIDGAGNHIFRIDVKDLGEPGKGVDHYRMRLDTGYDSGDRILKGGNVQIHKLA